MSHARRAPVCSGDARVTFRSPLHQPPARAATGPFIAIILTLDVIDREAVGPFFRLIDVDVTGKS